MDEVEVKTLMASSKSEDEWNRNCQKVKRLCGGDYPKFWFTAIIRSGLALKVEKNYDPVTG